VRRISVCLLAASLCAAARAQSIRTGVPLGVPAAGSGAAQAGAAGQAAASAPAAALNPKAGGLPPALTLPYAAPVLPSIGPQFPRSGMPAVVAGGKGANPDTEGSRQSDRALILGVRKRIRALVSGLREGRVWDELERLARSAFEDDDGVRTESARVLLRFIGDPQLIVQSRGFIASVGLGDAVGLDAVSRAVFQARPPDAGRKELMNRLKSNSSVEFDEALPRVKPRTRKLLLATPRFRLRELPAQSGMVERRDGEPDARGAGARNFGLPTYVRIQPPEAIGGGRSASVAKHLSMADQVRSDGPRVLSKRESILFRAGRSAPSSTLANARKNSREHENFGKASALVDRWLRNGEDLDLDKIQALGRALLEGTEHRRDAGRLRDFHNGLDLLGRSVPFAAWDLLPAYLEDFMAWYGANQDRMHPVQLAVLAYQQFVRIHPLVNTNGRAGRLIMDFILLKNGYLPPMFEILDRRTITDHSASVIEEVCLGIVRSVEALRPSAAQRLTWMIPDLVLFDWDDTLADNDRVERAAWEETVRQLRGKAASFEEQDHVWRTDRDAYYRRYFPGVPRRVVDETWDGLVAAARQGRPIGGKRYDDVPTLPGARDVLAALKARGVRLAVVSNKSEQQLLMEVERSGLRRYFDRVQGHTDRRKTKPSPQPVIEALEAMGIPPGNVWFVGDELTDMLASNQAGIRRVLIGGRSRSRVQAIEAAQDPAGPIVYANGHRELLAAVRRLPRPRRARRS